MTTCLENFSFSFLRVPTPFCSLSSCSFRPHLSLFVLSPFVRSLSFRFFLFTSWNYFPLFSTLSPRIPRRDNIIFRKSRNRASRFANLDRLRQFRSRSGYFLNFFHDNLNFPQVPVIPSSQFFLSQFTVLHKRKHNPAGCSPSSRG